MFRIPKEVFEHQILEFLTIDDTLTLLCSSNRLFAQLRYRSGKRIFEVTFSDLTESAFTHLLPKINPIEQLVVICKGALWQELLTKESMVAGQPLVPRKLFIMSWDDLTTTVDLSKVLEVSLIICKITETNCFSHLTRLSLYYCPGIHDVQNLGNISNLSINGCQGIRDISALLNNRSLSIHNCKNISLSTVNFVNVLHLSTDLPLTYSETTTLKNVVSLKLLFFCCSAIYLSSTVVSVEIRNRIDPTLSFTMICPPLHMNLSNFSETLNFVLLENMLSTVDLTPLGSITKVQLEYCHEFMNVNGLGKNNKSVIIKFCYNIRDLSALKTVPRVAVDGCPQFSNCEDLNQVHYLTIERGSSEMDFSGLNREKGCRVHRLELLDCESTLSFQGLDEIPFLKIFSCGLLSLEGLGAEENKIIILRAEYESSADKVLSKDCYSKTFYNDIVSGNTYLMLQLMRK
jgi:hypothetical protein